MVLLFQERQRPRLLAVDEADINSPAEGGHKAKERTTGFARGNL